MTVGHVTLNSREYMIDLRQYSQAIANQMAPKVSQGEASYASLDSWSAWVQSDWQNGIARVDPHLEDGGYLYGDLETRIPKQIILGPKLFQTDQRQEFATTSDCRNQLAQLTHSITVGSGGVDRIAVQFTTPATSSLQNAAFLAAQSFWVYAYVPNGVTIRLSIYSDSAGTPNASLASATVVADESNFNYYWWGAPITYTLAQSTAYWLVVEPTSLSNTIYVACSNTDYNVASKTYASSTWSANTDRYMQYRTDIYSTNPAAFAVGGTGNGSVFFRFNGNTYYTRKNTIWKYSSANNKWSYVTSAGSNPIRSAAVFGPTVYFGTSSNDVYTMNTSEVTANVPGYDAHIFLTFRDLLYRADGNDVYYSADASTWEGPFVFGGSTSVITGLAGTGMDVYVTNEKALYRLAPGDVVEELSRFGSEDEGNGLGMVEYGGAIFIPANGRLFRYDPSGTIMDVWVSRQDDLPNARLGRIDALCVMNNWLLAYVNARKGIPKASILAYQTTGWHPLATLPNETPPLDDVTDLTLFYDRANSKLWISGNALGPLYLNIDDYALNPYTITTYQFQSTGWIEWDWFDGPVRTMRKDYESVTVIGENFTSGRYAQVYWKDDASTDWEYLGQCTSNQTELIWTDSATRPYTRRLKIGMRLYSNNRFSTPKVEAITVKYHPMVTDWFVFNVPILVSGNDRGTPQQLLDGDANAYSADEIKSALDALATQGPPFIFKDPTGVQYVVKVKEPSSFTLQDLKWMDATSAREWAGFYMVTLEQVRAGAYTP